LPIQLVQQALYRATVAGGVALRHHPGSYLIAFSSLGKGGKAFAPHIKWGAYKRSSFPRHVYRGSHVFSHRLSKHGLQQSNDPYSPSDPSIDMMVVVVSQISHLYVPISMDVLLP
jgi:hypothetical protein